MSAALELARAALSSKHHWSKHIHASAARLRDIHIATTFVAHSLRPRLAAQQQRHGGEAARQRSVLASVTASAGGLHAPSAIGGQRRGGSSTAQKDAMKSSLGASISLPAIGRGGRSA